ncbi:MAG: cell division protein FtsZ [Candidatus Liptonbacteria bacterium CG11_big_fil_rev_8_21_14_0_20_35_14]|uniref:Cell division protein FtsZ n=1 Tax=Candidatus Liptonbacteria bacterium CG11_big_fil_rev_8_21_14_0_20_35_14 TaxID=1974634 RepID=A0A2H0NAR7_9BACT|nr:MAG: cell division protein FtsZ [Candidatus Liptonbacteria bacterium CG11_big_fil_rev_8_21_14_0_20_35_14]
MAVKKKKIKLNKEDKNTNIVNIKVVGVGGGGGNAISRMSLDFPRGVEFVAINTDVQDLEFSSAKKRIHIGKSVTGGLGAGMNPELGAKSAEENKPEIVDALAGADLIFLTAGFGGGTGTGALPIVAEVAREQGALTIAVVTKPFAFEGAHRARIAQEGLMKMRDKVDALIVIPNDRIFSVINKDTPIIKAFEEIDNVLKSAVQGIVDLIVSVGIINVDFADIKAIIKNAGSAIVGVGIGSGQERCTDAVRQALNSPLLGVSSEGARGILFGVSGGRDLKMTEINEAASLISESVDPGAKIIFGAYNDKRLKQGQVKVTLIATGFNDASNRSSIGSLFGSSGSVQKDPAVGALRRSPEIEAAIQKRKRDPLSIMDTDDGRKKEVESVNDVSELENEEIKDSMWDIPTFLRRKKRE